MNIEHYDQPSFIYDSNQSSGEEVSFLPRIFDIHSLPCKMIFPHWHDDFEFIYLLSGKLAFHINHKTYVASAGEGFFINAGQVHYAQQYEEYDCRFLSFQISPSMLYQNEQDPVFQKYFLPISTNPSFCHMTLTPKVPWQKYILENIKKIIALCQEKNYGYELKVYHFIHENFYYVLQNIASLPDLSKKERKDIERIKQGMIYLDQTYVQKHTLEDISKACSLSRSECCRLFQRILNCSPIDYLIKIRIQNSLPLIVAHDLSMTEIAKRTGFSGSSYFSETFKKVMGHTPREFYKQCCIEKK